MKTVLLVSSIAAIGISLTILVFVYQHIQNCENDGGSITGFLECNKSEYNIMSELFQQKYTLTRGTIIDEANGATIETVSTDQHGNSITLLIKENINGPYYAKITCEHKTLGKTEILMEDIMRYLQNKNCFSMSESKPVAENMTDLDLQSYLLTIDDKTYHIKYSLNNAELQQITKRTHENSILIKLNNATKGHLTISIPYDLIDAKYDNTDYVLIILVDAEETNYTEVKNQFERTVTIDFDEETTRIEIIGTKLI